MSDNRKDFFYNSNFRLIVYVNAWIFLQCFKIFTSLNPKWEEIVGKYEKGHAIAPAIIGFASGLIFEIVLFIFMYINLNWTLKNIIFLTLFYLLIGLMGWLSLVKFRDYEREKSLRRR
jgi:hypothetical protein